MNSSGADEHQEANENEIEYNESKKKSHRSDKKMKLNKKPSTTKKAKLVPKTGE